MERLLTQSVSHLSFYTDVILIHRWTIANFGVDTILVDYATSSGGNQPQNAQIDRTGISPLTPKRLGNDRKLRTPEGVSWGVYKDAGVPVYGKTLGIIGMGRIGQSIARRAVASGMSIIYHNRNRLDAAIEQEYGARWVTRDELLETADFISLNAPSTPETLQMIGEEQFNQMKPTAVFINTARGNMVDEKAMARALKEGKIWAAGLDVYENEPHILPELLELDNVVLAPHAGTKTVEDRIAMSEEMCRNIVGYYEGTYPVMRVN